MRRFIHACIILYIPILLACSNGSDKGHLSDCPKIKADTIPIYIGQHFVDDTVSILINNYLYLAQVVTTNKSIEVASVKTIPSDTVKNLQFVVNGKDAIVLCPARFVIMNFVNGKFRTELLDSIPKLQFL